MNYTFKINKNSPIIIAIALLICTIIIISIIHNSNTTNNPTTNADFVNNTIEIKKDDFSPTYGEYYSHNEEMMAIWVPYMTLNTSDDYSEKSFKENFDNIVKTSQEHNINTLIVHIRPFSDSLYPSEYYPYSHILTGEQGKDPGFDPLQYMLEACHNAKMEFHAWINPLRVKLEENPSKISEDSPYYKWKDKDDYIMEYEKNLYLNPAYEEVRKYIIDGIKEIVLNYAIDAIHFDDYFYPTTQVGIDETAYKSYTKQVNENNVPLTLNSFRTANINSLISGVYSGIKSITNNVQFGISPQANIENDMSMNADVYSWASISGYCDYLCPQVYVNFEHPLLPYNSTVEEWQSITTNENVKLYIGLALYKAGSDVDDGTWTNSDSILKEEIEYGREKGVDGFMIYSYDYLENQQTAKEVANIVDIM